MATDPVIPEGWSIDPDQTAPAAAPPTSTAPPDSQTPSIPAGWSIDTDQTAPASSTAGEIWKGGTSGVAQALSGVVSGPVAASNWLARQAIKFRYGVTDAELDQRMADARAGKLGADAQKGAANIDDLTRGAQWTQEKIASAVDPVMKGIGGAGSTYQPTTGVGKGAQMVGAFLPGAVGGEATLPALAGRIATRAVAPATGAYVGGQIGQSLGGTPGSEVAGQILGSVAPAILARTPPLSTAMEAAVPRVAPELAEAGERQGWQLPVGIASESAPVNFLGRTIQSVPIAGALPARAYGNLYEQMGQTAQQATAGAPSRVAAGELVRSGYEDWLNGVRPDVTAAFEGPGSARALVPQNQQFDLGATRGGIQQIASQYDAMRQPMPGSIQRVLDAATDPNGLTFSGITDLRTMIGKLKNNWGQVTAQGLNSAELERIYGWLTQDAENAALQGGGQQAVDAWRRARDLQASVANRRQAVAQALGAQGQASGEQIMSSIQRMAGPSTSASADIEGLRQIRGTIGNQEWQGISQAVAQDMGFDPTTGRFSPARLLSAYQKNLSPEGRDILFGPAGTPGLRQTYDDLTTVAKKAKILDKYANPSGTAQTEKGGDFLTDLLIDPGLALKGTALSGGMGVLLARPATGSSLSRLTRTYQAYTTAQRAGRATAAMQRNLYGATRNFANTANAAGFQVDPNDLYGRMTQGQQQ